jgi:hypothetical protein
MITADDIKFLILPANGRSTLRPVNLCGQSGVCYILLEPVQSMEITLSLEAYLLVSVNINQLKLLGLKRYTTALFRISHRAVAIVNVWWMCGHTVYDALQVTCRWCLWHMPCLWTCIWHNWEIRCGFSWRQIRKHATLRNSDTHNKGRE